MDDGQDMGASLQDRALDELKTRISERSEDVRTAMLRLGDLPLPVEAQFKLGELYAGLGDFVAVVAQGMQSAKAQSDRMRLATGDDHG